MSSGHIYVAGREGVYVIKLVGDVRLTLCVSFDQFIAAMFAEDGMRSVIFDLREAEGIDSTTLGLMAKISIGARHRGLDAPVVITSNPSITRLLVSMGFEDILKLVDESDVPSADAVQLLADQTQDEAAVQARVLEAHKILMQMNRPNEVKFQELVETLQGKR